MKEIRIEDVVYIDELHTGVYSDTLKITEITGQKHFDVMKKAKRLAKVQDRNKRNFSFITYSDSRNRTRDMIQLDKAGTLALLLSFKGKKYDKLRLDVANRFVAMEEELVVWENSRHILKQDTKTMHDSLKPLSGALNEMYPESRKGDLLYTHTHKKINKAVLGKGTGADRDLLSVDMINRLDVMEHNVKTLLHEWEPYNPMAVRVSIFKWIDARAS